MTVGVLLAHGWCFGSTMWEPLVPLLHANICITPDFGYFCEPELPSHLQPSVLIGVGHSFGFLWLLKQRKYKLDGLIGISSVPSFRESHSGHVAISAEDLLIARSRISKSPRSFVQWFQKKCGVPFHDRRIGPHCIDGGAILRDLTFLEQWNVRDELEQTRVPVRVLGASDDKILSPGNIQTSFRGLSGVDIIIESGSGHILPMLNPEKCAETINGLIQELAVS